MTLGFKTQEYGLFRNTNRWIIRPTHTNTVALPTVSGNTFTPSDTSANNIGRNSAKHAGQAGTLTAQGGISAINLSEDVVDKLILSRSEAADVKDIIL